MKKKTRVLYIETSTEGTIGGSHHSLYQLVCAVQNYGIEPIVVFYEENDLIPTFRDAGCIVHILNKPERKSMLKAAGPIKPIFRVIESFFFFSYLSTALALKNYLWLKKHKIDLVHLNNNPFSMDWLIASKLHRAPCIAHQRGIRTQLDRSEIVMARCMDRVVCISEYVWNSLKLSGCKTKNFTLIHNGVDISSFSPRPKNYKLLQALAIDSGNVVIGMIGNIKEWKGQHVLVEALGKLVASYPNITVLFVGKFDRHSENYKARILKLSETSGLTENLIFTGYTPNIKEHITLMDIVVHASIQPEPFGRVIIEAMSMGKPVVASNDGGVREIIQHEQSGLLFEPGNSGELAECISRALGRSDLMSSLSSNGRAHVSEHFSIENNARKTVAVYNQLLKTYAAS